MGMYSPSRIPNKERKVQALLDDEAVSGYEDWFVRVLVADRGFWFLNRNDIRYFAPDKINRLVKSSVAKSSLR